MLVYVQNDKEYMRVRRHGRFSLERACAASPTHRLQATKAAIAKFIHTMNRQGHRYIDDGNLEIQGNLPHYEYAEDITPDLGPLAAPDPLDLRACAEFERAEKARQARDVAYQDLTDFRVILTFEKAVAPTFRLINKGAR